MMHLGAIKRRNKAKDVGDKLGEENGQTHLGRKYRHFEMVSKAPWEESEPVPTVVPAYYWIER